MTRPGALGLGFAVLAAACQRTAPTTPANTVREGVAIAVYDRGEGEGYGVVDDRRWVEVTGATLVLDRVDPAAALQSLVIEPLAGGAFEVGACLRAQVGFAPPPASRPPVPTELDPADPPPVLDVSGLDARGAGSRDIGAPPSAGPVMAPVLRCAVRAAPGRYLVRVLYVSPSLGYRAQHDIAMTAPDRATVASRFALVTPDWHERAELTVFRGMPGSESPPRELAHGTIALDGGTAVVAPPPRTVAAQLRRIYASPVPRADAAGARDAVWASESQPAVWVCLELDDLRPAVVAGIARVAIDVAGEPRRVVTLPYAGGERGAPALRLPLWIDDQLRGRRERSTEAKRDSERTDRFAITLVNTGDAAREVWIEEPLRPARRRSIVKAWPGEPSIVQRALRMKLTVPAGKVEHGGFEIHYDY